MVTIPGLDTFINFFKGYEDHYALIGGAACSLWLEEQGLPFRATKDLDLVVIVEGVTNEFFKRFWLFIDAGNYRSGERKDGSLQLYRFQDPGTDGFPAMLELLTRNILEIPDTAHLTPIPITGNIDSLSAILLDEAYYKLVLENRISIQGATIIPAHSLIPLKVKAWLDLTARRKAGDVSIRGDDIRKHRNDVFRLLVAMTPTDRVSLPKQICEDLELFIAAISADKDVWRSIEDSVQNTLGVAIPSQSESFTLIRQIFGI